MRIAREGLPFLLPALAAGLAGALLGWIPLAIPGFLLAAAFAFFFRDPERTPPPGEHLLVSPADGRVVRVDPLDHDPGIGGPAVRVAVFLSLTDVHLTRAPLAAGVARADYHPGKFFPAYRDEASELNESCTLVFRDGAIPLVLKQIVGVAARRIKCFVRAGDAVRRGQRIGLMYFGSRVELTLPRDAVLRVAPGLKVRGGETVIAEVQP